MKLLTKIRRERMQMQAREAVAALERSFAYLWEDYWKWASTKDRDALTVPQRESLDMLNRAAREALSRSIGAQA